MFVPFFLFRCPELYEKLACKMKKVLVEYGGTTGRKFRKLVGKFIKAYMNVMLLISSNPGKLELVNRALIVLVVKTISTN